MLKNLFLAAALALVCQFAHGQVTQLQSFAATGKTITVTGATSAPTPVQTSSPVVGSQQYLIVNNGTVTGFIAYGSTAAIATTNCVIPTGTTAKQHPASRRRRVHHHRGVQPVLCVLTGSSTAVFYITPGSGS